MSGTELRDELRSALTEPLLPVEKKLVAYSLAVGIVLLAALFLFNALYPV